MIFELIIQGIVFGLFVVLWCLVAALVILGISVVWYIGQVITPILMTTYLARRYPNLMVGGVKADDRVAHKKRKR